MPSGGEEQERMRHCEPKIAIVQSRIAGLERDFGGKGVIYGESSDAITRIAAEAAFQKYCTANARKPIHHARLYAVNLLVSAPTWRPKLSPPLTGSPQRVANLPSQHKVHGSL